MELTAAVRERRSIRKFKLDEVPQKLLREILDEARWSPSWGNTQSWEFYVLTGKTLAEFKKMNREKAAAGEAHSPDVPMPESWPEYMKDRYAQTGKVVLSALGIKREDKESRNKYYLDMASFFDAPCLILACIPRDHVVEYPMLDVGIIIQSICLLAQDKGLGTCIMAVAARYPKAIRKIASIPDDKRIIVGIAVGYPDLDSPLNRIDRQRAETGEFVHWVE